MYWFQTAVAVRGLSHEAHVSWAKEQPHSFAETRFPLDADEVEALEAEATWSDERLEALRSGLGNEWQAAADKLHWARIRVAAALPTEMVDDNLS